MGGLGCLGLGAVIVWSLGAINKQATRRARQEQALQSQAAAGWDYRGPQPLD